MPDDPAKQLDDLAAAYEEAAARLRHAAKGVRMALSGARQSLLEIDISSATQTPGVVYRQTPFHKMYEGLSQAAAAEAYIKSVGRPVDKEELFVVLQERGVKLTSRESLSVALSRSPALAFVSGQGWATKAVQFSSVRDHVAELARLRAGGNSSGAQIDHMNNTDSRGEKGLTPLDKLGAQVRTEFDKLKSALNPNSIYSSFL